MITTFKNTIKELSGLISTRKELIDPTTSSKTYWSILKTFCNGRKKTPIVYPLLINNKLESDFKKKAHHFNVFFGSKCTSLISNSVIPDLFDYMSTPRFASINFNNVSILKIIKSMNDNKAHGHDDISVRMINCMVNQLSSPY